MCLKVTGNSRIKVAASDIQCLKVGSIGSTERELFRPYFRTGFYYKKDKVTSEVNLTINEYREVESGYHSFPNLKSLYNHFGRKMFKEPSREIGVFIIPKGAAYIEGKFETSDCICSSRIVYKGQLTFWMVLKRFLIGKYV